MKPNPGGAPGTPAITYPLRCYRNGPITWRSIISINAVRSASAAVNSFAASLAVLPFEPHMKCRRATPRPRQPSRPDHGIAPKNIAARTMPPPVMAIREARMNLRQLSILAASSSMCASSARSRRAGRRRFWGIQSASLPKDTAHLDTLFAGTMIHAWRRCWTSQLGCGTLAERYEVVHIELVPAVFTVCSFANHDHKSESKRVWGPAVARSRMKTLC